MGVSYPEGPQPDRRHTHPGTKVRVITQIVHTALGTEKLQGVIPLWHHQTLPLTVHARVRLTWQIGLEAGAALGH